MQQMPYYKAIWKELLQVNVHPPVLIQKQPGYELEAGTSSAVNSYVFVCIDGKTFYSFIISH
jgi:hypothetical protein